MGSRGRGFWKFNTSLLHDSVYLEMIRRTVQQVTEQYALPNQELTSKHVKFSIDDQLFFETLKMEIRGNSIAYSSRKKKNRNAEEKKLAEEIETIEQRLSESPSEELLQIYRTKKLDLEKLREPNIRGMMVRSRANWVEHGEKPSKYFCQLEKRHYTSRIINRLEIDGKVVSNPKEILVEQAAFYKRLYSGTNPDIESEESKYFFQDRHLHTLDENQDKHVKVL